MGFRHPGRLARLVFATVLLLFGGIAVIAAWFGWWIFVGASLVLAALFALSAPFVLGRGWKPSPPRRTRRPVVRHRR